MKTRRVAIFGFTIASAVFGAGCTGVVDDTGSAENDVQTGWLDAGTNLGKATHVFADVQDEAVFVVFDRKLERRRTDGAVESIGSVAAGFANLAASRDRIAWVCSTLRSGRVKTTLSVIARATGHLLRTEDLSTPKYLLRHPLLFLDDGSLIVGSGDALLRFPPRGDGPPARIGGAASPLAGAEALSLHARSASAFLAVMSDGDVHGVDAQGIITPRVRRGAERALFTAFDRRRKRWVTVDHLGVAVHAEDGALVRRVELGSKKRRTIGAAALLADGSVLVAHGSEARRERSVLAVYEPTSLARREWGTLDGTATLLSTSEDHVFFAFSPTGAAGFDSRVNYAYARRL